MGQEMKRVGDQDHCFPLITQRPEDCTMEKSLSNVCINLKIDQLAFEEWKWTTGKLPADNGSSRMTISAP